MDKHHQAPNCCGLSDFPNNRCHYQQGECTGCDHPTHYREHDA